MQLVTAKEMQTMDRLTIESFGIPGRVLMENAGRGATRFLSRIIPDIETKRVGIMAGKGNNGGDGFVIARYLFQRGVDVEVFLLADRRQLKPGDAESNLELLTPLGVQVTEFPDERAFNTYKPKLERFDAWVDAILGTGLASDVKGFFKTVIEYLNQSQKPVFSVDIPSGLNSDTGQVCGVSVEAMATATFAFAKTGHFQYPGARLSGDLNVIDIGIPPHVVKEVAPFQTLMTPQLISSLLKPRALDTHKGQNGHLLVVAGSTGKTGAAVMASMSALRIGAGLVTLAVPASLNAVIEPMLVEGMSVGLPESKKGILSKAGLQTVLDHLDGMKCVALGPGIGTADETKAFVKSLLSHLNVPVVVDADGLNCLVEDLDILKKLKIPVIMTPHPGEMARLTGFRTKTIQTDRIQTARNFAAQYHLHLVLKGAGTVIAHPDGSVFINPTGNPGMASGGMGDVLTGVIAGLITQGFDPKIAVNLGVYLHGLSADRVAEEKGAIGYLATEVMSGLPAALSMGKALQAMVVPPGGLARWK